MAEDQNLNAIVRSLLGLSSSQQPMETNALIRELARRIVLSGVSFDETTGAPTGILGSALTDLNADELTSGTVPLARLVDITNTEIAAAAAIAYSKLNLATSIVNADIAVAAAIAWSKLSKTGSSLADLDTRSAGDLSSGTLPDARFPATLPAISGANLTNLDATDLTGTIADARLGSNVPLKDGTNTFSGANTFSNAAGLVLSHASGGLKERNRSVFMGEWTTPAFNAADYTASAGNWTVDSGDVTVFAYTLIGKTMIILFQIQDTDVSATPATLVRALPGGVTAAKTARNIMMYSDAGGANAAGFVTIAGSGTTMTFAQLSGSWTATSSDNTAVFGQIAFEIQ